MEWFGDWQRAGFIREESASQWRASGFEPQDASPWYHLDVVGPEVAIKWQDCGIGPQEYVVWARAKVLDPGTAVIWKEFGIDAETAVLWHRAGVRDLDLLLRLRNHNFDWRFAKECNVPGRREALLEWLNHLERQISSITPRTQVWILLGVFPASAIEWEELGVGPSEFVILHSHGVSMKELRKRKFSVDEIGALVRLLPIVGGTSDFFELFDEGLGIETISKIFSASIHPRSALKWASAGVTQADDMIFYESHGVHVDHVQKLLNAGANCRMYVEACDGSSVIMNDWLSADVFDYRVVQNLRSSGLKPEALKAWTLEGVTESSLIAEWTEVSPDPRVASSWMKLNVDVFLAKKLQKFLSSADYEKLLSEGVTSQEICSIVESRPFIEVQMRQFLMNHLYRVIDEWRRLRIPVEDWFGWFRETNGDDSLVNLWVSHRITLMNFRRAKRLSRDRLSAVVVRDWVSAERDVLAEFQRVESGLYEWYPNNRSISSDFHAGRVTPAQLRKQSVGNAVMTSSRRVNGVGVRWIETTSVRATEEWVNDIQDICDFLLPSIRKDMSLSRVFEDESQGWKLEMTKVGNEIKVSVHDSSGDSETVRFGLSSLDPSTPVDSARSRLVFGLGVMWFLDWSVVFRHNAKSFPIHFSQRGDLGNTRLDRLVRYVPTFSFSSARSVPISAHASPIGHLVVGHVRTLPDRMQPSIEARLNAPAHIRKRMGKNDTYVRPHARGSDSGQAEVRNALSHTSALGRALRTL